MKLQASLWPKTVFAAVCALGLALVSLQSAAQAWPKKQPIKIVVPWAPGGAADYLARLLSPSMSQDLAQSVIVENRAGGATNIGSDAVAKAAPDGYTLLMASSNNAVNMSLFKTRSYDFVHDFVPVALIGYTPLVLVVNSALPVKDLSAFIQYAKANPGKVSYASAGIGSPAHLAAEKLQRAADIQMIQIPYRGAAPAVGDLIGGQVQVMITNIPSVIGHVRTGKLRALAITGKARSTALPATPTFAEDGLPHYDANAWYGLVAPRGTPAAVAEQLRASVARALADPTLAQKIDQQGVEAVAKGTPAAFAKVIEDDIVGYRELIQKAGITAD